MNELCFISNLTSAEWASWVQAVGSVVAIAAAVWISTNQANRQYENSLNLNKTEKRTEKESITKALYVLAVNSSSAMKQISETLEDREAVHKVAEGLVACNIGEIVRIDKYLSNIPIHSIPDSMISLTMILGSTVRQFKDNIENTLMRHRSMDSESFDDLFHAIDEMNTSIVATCNDIKTEIERLKTSV